MTGLCRRHPVGAERVACEIPEGECARVRGVVQHVSRRCRSKWPPNLLTDARVIHRWDEPKAVGLWYAPHTASIHGELAPGSQWRDGAILWDAYLLYGPDAKWADAPTTGLIRWGRTIVAGRDPLKDDFAKLFATGATATPR